VESSCEFGIEPSSSMKCWECWETIQISIAVYTLAQCSIPVRQAEEAVEPSLSPLVQVSLRGCMG
jgi:hypothetical protein